MIFIVFVLSGEMVFIIIIVYQNFRIRLEAINWMPSNFISTISIQCNESLEDFMDFEDYNSYSFISLDNYYSDQEHWFDVDD